ncbi:hypothetical protein [Mesorhizobium sp. M1136]|uniref:hypothetical protein n=1 Tax=Mesorhizobium sp. M1136 TaxID=2957059 RepID=UPI003338C005
MAKHRTHSGKDTDLVVLSVFNPPLNATERHDLKNGDSSSYRSGDARPNAHGRPARQITAWHGKT